MPQPHSFAAMNRMFKDELLQRTFETEGYLKLQLLSAEEVQQLRGLYHRLTDAAPTGFFTTYLSPDEHYKREVRKGILPVFEPKLRELFVDPHPLLCSFLAKTKAEGHAGYVSAHQDWSFVDETAGDVSINIWCPLEETREENGNLYVVPGSHLLPRFPRQADGHGTPFQPFYELLKQAGVAVPTQPGEAIFFDNALVHYSSFNQTDSLRLVAGTLVVSSRARAVLYFQNATDEKLLDEYETDVEYYLKKPIGHRPDRFLRTVPKVEVPDAAAQIALRYPEIVFPEPQTASVVAEEHKAPLFTGGVRAWWRKIFR